MIAIPGFTLHTSGPNVGLVEVNFKNIEIHGVRSSPEFVEGQRKKAIHVDRTIKSELTRGTKHYDHERKPLKTYQAIMEHYMRTGSVFMEPRKEFREKLEAIFKGDAQARVDEAHQGGADQALRAPR